MKNDFASDPNNLNPTTRSFNSSKGSRTPDQLTGIAASIIDTDAEKCDYATQHDEVKTTYDLSMTESEAATVMLWLSLCETATVGRTGTDREALVAFYHAANGDGWIQNDNWLSASALTAWRGVNMRQDGRVEGLFIRSNGLSGHLAPELGNLSEMDYLDLGFNQLTGSIPSQLGNLPKLESIYLFDNRLSGPIPATLGNIGVLRTLHLANNQLTGPIPAELGNLSNLKQLFLQGNNLSGPIPASLGNLDNLEWVHLSANNLTGCVPAGLQDVPNNDFDRLGLPFC